MAEAPTRGKKESLFRDKKPAAMKNVEDPKAGSGAKPEDSGTKTATGPETSSGPKTESSPAPVPRNDMAKRHAAERGAMAVRHEDERRNLHGQIREDHRKMNAEHEADYKRMAA